MTTRTTASLEAYNGILGRIICKKGNFFKFVETLRMEEFEKATKFNTLIESGGTVGAKQSKKFYVHKNDKIMEASTLLEQGKLTPMMFLNRLSFQKNKIMQDLDPEEIIFEEDKPHVDNSSSDELEGVSEDPCTSLSAKNGPYCIICQDASPNIAFLPCKHMKCCNECIIKLQAQCIADNRKLQCPCCRENVEDTLTLYV